MAAHRSLHRPAFIAACAILAWAATAAAQDSDDDGELDDSESAELARAVQNPVANLISLPFQYNTTFDFGPRDKPLHVLNVQPVWPFELSEDWNLITRTILPVTSQPQLRPGQDREFGLGDTLFTGFLSPVKPFHGVILGAGPAVLVPTATADRLGAQKWGAGPSFVALTMPGSWVVGSLFSNVWSFEGGNRAVNLFTWQYFVNYNFADGWYLTSAPILTANWEAKRSSDEWTVPFGGGFGRVFRLNGLPPMNASIQGFYHAARPRSVGLWSMRLQLQLMFPR
jgi:hypothetical protein